MSLNDPTLPVDLNLEESGHLCHLIMTELQPYILRQKRPKDAVEVAILTRRMKLYDRLSKLNDQLMGKTSGA